MSSLYIQTYTRIYLNIRILYVFICGLGLGLKWTGRKRYTLLASFYIYVQYIIIPGNYRGQTFLDIHIHSSYKTTIQHRDAHTKN